MNYVLLVTFSFSFLVGCTTRTVSNTPRTAIEQLLLSTAADHALSKLHFPELSGKKVYLDFTNLQAYDTEYIKSAVQTVIAENNSIIVVTPEGADHVVQVSSGGFGNEYKETLVGIPALPVPGSAMTLPELALWKTVEQDGIIKLLITVYSDSQIVSANHYYGKAERDETFFLWIRSQAKDDIRKAWEEADEKLHVGQSLQ
ncbi:MAG: hypothetical protein JSV82_00615 [Planctomycetota bacterium]|nr:MAG: hypothetical protein JSV82_00615 [Planctomycetota bacterium]